MSKYTAQFISAVNKGYDVTIYLCVTEDNYCHAVFSARGYAEAFCQKHTTYHVVERTLDKTY